MSSALSCAVLLGACAERVYQPAPIPPATETVAVYRDLPPNLIAPCERPAVDPAAIETDVDLLGLASRALTALDRCADQVEAIGRIYAGARTPRRPQP